MHISGVEIHDWMVQYAKAQTPEKLSKQLDFTVYDSQGNLPFAANNFDLIYSKEALNYVHAS
jgi:ubiquinone/menaquinone biosynthesis C-methylase UbiE